MKKLLCSFLLALGLVGQGSIQASGDFKASLMDAWKWAKPVAQIYAPVIFEVLIKQGIKIPDVAYAHLGLQAPKKTMFGNAWSWMKWGHAGLISGMEMWKFYGPAVMAAWNMMQKDSVDNQNSGDTVLANLKYEDLTAQEKQLFMALATEQQQEQQALRQKIQIKMQEEGRAPGQYTKAEYKEMNQMHQKHLADRQELLKYIEQKRAESGQSHTTTPNVAPVQSAVPVAQAAPVAQPRVDQPQVSGPTHFVAPIVKKKSGRAVARGGCAC